MSGDALAFLFLWIITILAGIALFVLYIRERRKRRPFSSLEQKVKEEVELKNKALCDLNESTENYKNLQHDTAIRKEVTADEIHRMEQRVSDLLTELHNQKTYVSSTPGRMAQTPRRTPRIMPLIQGNSFGSGEQPNMDRSFDEQSSNFPAEAGEDLPALRQMLAWQCERVEKLQAAAKAHEAKIAILPQMQDMIREAHEMAQKYKEQRDIIDHEKSEFAEKLEVEQDRVKLLCQIIQQLKSRMVDLCPPTPRAPSEAPISYGDLGEDAQRLLDSLPEMSPIRWGVCTPRSFVDVSMGSELFQRESEETEQTVMDCGASQSTRANQLQPCPATADKLMDSPPSLAKIDSLSSEINSIFGLRGS